jgi:predicted alpha/beta-fold hydrolase
LNKHGYTVVVINHIAPREGEGDLRLLNFSNAQALKETVMHMKAKFGSDCKILGVGFSMGGNHLIRYLGDYKTSSDSSGVHAAMTIGNPFDVLATGL